MIWRLLFVMALWPGLTHAACAVRQRAVVALEITGTIVLVPVTVNGIPGRFILDTGAAQTVVTPDAVGRFNLALDEWTATTTRGIGGIERRRNANPRSVELGGVMLHRRGLAGDTTLRVATLSGRSPAADGLLGRDFLSAFDLDLNFAERRLTLFDVAGCAGQFLPWNTPYLSVPVEHPAETAWIVRVELDGIALRALLDSGASQTLLAATGMARLDLGIDRLRNDPSEIVSGLGPHTVTMWHHRFQTFRVVGETMAAPSFLVAPVQISPISDMLLGADWMMGREVWISHATGQLFVTR